MRFLPKRNAISVEHLDLEKVEEGDRAFVLETWRTEAMALSEYERAITGSGARALAAALTLLGIGIAYGIAGKGAGHGMVLFALPPALALIGIELNQNFGDALAVVQARSRIEEALREACGTTVLLYGRYVHARRHRSEGRRLATLVTGIYGLVLVAMPVLLWIYVPTTTKGRPVFQDAETVRTIALTFTLLCFAAYAITALDNLTLRPEPTPTASKPPDPPFPTADKPAAEAPLASE